MESEQEAESASDPRRERSGERVTYEVALELIRALAPVVEQIKRHSADLGPADFIQEGTCGLDDFDDDDGGMGGCNMQGGSCFD
jgi:hypothetical protein